MTPRSPEAALKKAVQEAAHPSKDYSGLCLQAVRELLRVPANAPHARGAWEMVRPGDRRTGAAPPGYPIFWAVGRYGHVALSAGHGLCWSVDIRRRGRLDPVWIGEIEKRWGAKLLGWSQTLNGVRLL